MILQRVAWPENLASHMFALLHHRPEFASATTELRVLDSSGPVLDAKVTWVRTIVPGPAPHAATWCSRTPRCGCRWTGRCCPRIGPPRSTTWPTATGR